MNAGTFVFALAATSLRTCAAQACGRVPLESRIVGGSEARPGAWPWQVDIQMATSHVCGGSLIAKDWVLSAAHCFPDPSDVTLFTIYAGRHQLHGYNAYESQRRVTKVLVPGDYEAPQTGSDVALVQLDQPVAWSDHVQPVCLPAADASPIPSTTLCYVTGWGDTQEGVPLTGAGSLREVEVPIIEQTSCRSMYQVQAYDYEAVEIRSDMICAGFVEGGKDSCQGDSGGPLVCPLDNQTWIQAGVVSFGAGCAQPFRPGVYAKVSAFASFITSRVPEAQLRGGVSIRRTGWALLLGCTLASLLLLC